MTFKEIRDSLAAYNGQYFFNQTSNVLHDVKKMSRPCIADLKNMEIKNLQIVNDKNNILRIQVVQSTIEPKMAKAANKSQKRLFAKGFNLLTSYFNLCSHCFERNDPPFDL